VTEFQKNLEALKTRIELDPANAWKDLDNVVAEIVSLDEFKEFVRILFLNNKMIVPETQPRFAEDYLGALDTVMKSGFEKDPVFSKMRSDLGRVAWYLALALDTD
jgi:hypothetical protein